MYNEDTTWKQLLFFHSAETSQQYLKNCYHKIAVKDPEQKGYENSYPFIYYLEQGKVFYDQAINAPFSIKPVLLFYGLVHLIKASLLTVDPLYPSTTSVLAHGVSTRKRKKRQYQFYNDEVKVQKFGLCTYFSEQMFHVKHLEGEKFIMRDLFSLIAELDDAFLFIKNSNNITFLDQNKSGLWHIPNKIHESYYMSEKRLRHYLNTKHHGPLTWCDESNNILSFYQEASVQPPFRYHLFKQKACLPSTLHPYSQLHDLIIHYLLLYNLSMISRYETEWWFDLIKTTPNADFPFIKTFLSITEKKGPYLILQYLKSKLIKVL
ncbi:YaaC family protein [Bacillus sp. FSL K6-3431]|uniref:YaaC family protein n=1 Tax=Bacillus sp. FSL K6-3431 TaxID=2921500 RepID=UPI0030F8C87A